MSNDDTFSAFNDPTYQQYKEEAEKRWGMTDAYKQSQERVAKMSSADLQKIKQESDDINTIMAKLMKQGAAVGSIEVQKQIARHFKQISLFYDPSPEMYIGLGQMYVQDPRFAIHYEKVAEGLAKYMADAMKVFAHNLT